MTTWDLNDIQRHITDQIQEHIALDYKAADALAKTEGKIKEITKDVSAMANAAGGVLIYGVAEALHDKRLPGAIDGIDAHTYTKEWLEHIIHTIQPRIDGIIIHPISIPQQPMQVVYVVDIPQSTTVHQARDKRYYKRFNFQSVPMEDYEVRATMGRVKYPRMVPSFTIRKQTLFGMTFVNLEVVVENQGVIQAERVRFTLDLPPSLYPHKPPVFKKHQHTHDGISYRRVQYDNTKRDVIDEDHGGREKLGPSWFAPILPETTHVWTWTLPNRFRQQDIAAELIHWRIAADNAPVQTGTMLAQHIMWEFDPGSWIAAYHTLRHQQGTWILFLVLLALVLVITLRGVYSLIF